MYINVQYMSPASATPNSGTKSFRKTKINGKVARITSN